MKQCVYCHCSVTVTRTDVNVALGRPSWSSSAFMNMGPWLAVDGNTNGIVNSYHCLVTNYPEVHPWLVVDLGRPRDVSGVTVWNRNDGQYIKLFVCEYKNG